MNLLTTSCQAVAHAAGQFNVYWRNGRHGAGLMSVSVHRSFPDPEVIAELSALQWLLCQRAVFGATQNGKGLHLKVGAGAIRKAVRAVTAGDAEQFGKPHLKPYAHFLATRFAGAVLEVDKDRSWVPDRLPSDHATLSIRQPLPNTVEIPGLGVVAVSTHAFERFGERLCRQAGHDTWRLLRRVVNGPLQRIRRAPEAEAHLIAKHGREGELWVNPELGWGFVLVPQTPLPVMVTAYAVTECGGMKRLPDQSRVSTVC